MLSGPIAAMVWEGRDAVKTGRGNYPFLYFKHIVFHESVQFFSVPLTHWHRLLEQFVVTTQS